MKRLVLFSLMIVLAGVSAFSQISIYDYDIAATGATFEQRSDTMPSVTPGSAGTSQTWNFSSLASHDTMSYTAKNPATLPLGNRFTQANIALNEDGSANSFFFNKSTNSLISVGFTADYMGNGDTVCLVFSIPDTMLTFPSTYNSDFTTNVFGDTRSHVNISIDTSYMGTPVTVPVDSVRIIHHALKTSVIDAWGNLTLPNGMVPALRQNTYETSIDSIYAYINMPPVMQGWYYYQSFRDTIQQYNWWTKYAGNAIVSMNCNPTSGMVTKVDWLYFDDLGMNQTPENPEVMIYPNPATTMLNFTAVEGTGILLINSLGQVVKQVTASGQAQTMNVADLPRGFYILKQAGDNNSGQKIILQ